MKITYTNQEAKIVGISDKPCKYEIFTLKLRNGNDRNGNSDSTDVRRCRMQLSYSAHFPCINVRKPKQPTYVPLEFHCKDIQNHCRASLVEKSRQKPQRRMSIVSEVCAFL